MMKDHWWLQGDRSEGGGDESRVLECPVLVRRRDDDHGEERKESGG